MDDKGVKGATADQISVEKMNKILDDSRPAAEKIAETIEMIDSFKNVVDKDGNLSLPKKNYKE